MESTINDVIANHSDKFIQNEINNINFKYTYSKAYIFASTLKQGSDEKDDIFASVMLSIKEYEEAFRSHEFEYEIIFNPKGVTDFLNVVFKIEKELEELSNDNSRVIFLFLMHGSLTQDTHKDLLLSFHNKSVPYSFIKITIETILSKCKHILTILNTCYSGMARFSKLEYSVESKGRELITAGRDGNVNISFSIALARTLKYAFSSSVRVLNTYQIFTIANLIVQYYLSHINFSIPDYFSQINYTGTMLFLGKYCSPEPLTIAKLLIFIELHDFTNEKIQAITSIIRGLEDKNLIQIVEKNILERKINYLIKTSLTLVTGLKKILEFISPNDALLKILRMEFTPEK